LWKAWLSERGDCERQSPFKEAKYQPPPSAPAVQIKNATAAGEGKTRLFGGAWPCAADEPKEPLATGADADTVAEGVATGPEGTRRGAGGSPEGAAAPH